MGETLLDKVRRKLQELDERGRKFWRPQVGKNRVRILPAANPNDLFFVEVAQHYQIGPDKRTVTCPRSFELTCPLCDRAERLRTSGDAEKVLRAGKLVPTQRALMNIIDRASPDKGVQVWAAPLSVLRDLLAYIADPEYGNIVDPNKGFDVMIERTGQDLGTRYQVRVARHPSPVGMPDWREHLNDLRSVLPLFSTDKIEAIYKGIDTGEDEEDEEEE